MASAVAPMRESPQLSLVAIVDGDGVTRAPDAILFAVPWLHAIRSTATSAQAAAGFTSTRTPAVGGSYGAPPESLPTTRGPSGPATIRVSVMPMNRPCSTTPVVFLIASPQPGASLIPPSNVRSRIRLL